jgi:hypothetical protein
VKRTYILTLVLIASITCTAQSSCDQLVPKALELFGTIDALKSFPAQMQAQMSAQLAQDKSLSAGDREKFADAVLKGMDVDRLTKSVQQSMITSCKAEEYKTVLEQLNTPLFQKMRAFEEASNTAETAQQLQKNMQSPAVKSPPEKRAALIHQLVSVSGAADSMVDTVVETARALREGMGAPPPDVQQMADLRKRVTANAGPQMNQMMLAVYLDATDAEMEKYIAVLGTKSFADFNSALSKAMVQGMAEESRYAGMALRKAIDQKQAEQPSPAVTPKP